MELTDLQVIELIDKQDAKHIQAQSKASRLTGKPKQAAIKQANIERMKLQALQLYHCLELLERDGSENKPVVGQTKRGTVYVCPPLKSLASEFVDVVITTTDVNRLNAGTDKFIPLLNIFATKH